MEAGRGGFTGAVWWLLNVLEHWWRK